MKRLINFIKRNKSSFLTILALVLVLTTIFSIIMPNLLMFCLLSIALGVVASIIICDLNDKVRKDEAIARQQNFKDYDE